MRKINVTPNEKTYSFLKDSRKRVNILYGSAGSGKSWSIAQFLLFEKFYKERNIRMLMIRKTRPAIKKSIWLLMNDLVKKYDMPLDDINKSDLTLTFGTNQMFFVPLDDPEKLKSFEKINYIWGEEATELTRDDYLQLGLRCRGENTNGKNALYYSFNPVDEHSFWKPFTEEPLPNMAVNHSTYKDNAFLDDDYVESIESLQEQDETYWKIYGQGIWASPEHQIYGHWDEVEEFPDNCDVGYGLDFGYNAPTALIKIGMKDEEAYFDETIYQTKLTNTDLIALLKQNNVDPGDEIVADCAEPQRIEEIYNAGFNIKPAIKGKDSVRAGIGKVKSIKCHVTKASANLIAERNTYKWKVDKNGIVLDEPVRFKDHGLDGLRYYLSERITKAPIGTDDFAVAGQTRDFGGSNEYMDQNEMDISR